MRKELWNEIKYGDSSYSNELKSFFDRYIYLLDMLNQKENDGNLNDEEVFYVKKLNEWITDKGYSFVVDTIACLDETIADKVRAFIELYSHLLKSVADDVESLVDQMLYTISQFKKDFMKQENLMLSGTCIMNVEDSYEICNLGNLPVGSLFLGG